MDIKMFVDKISKSTSCPVDYHFIGNYYSDTIIRIHYNIDPKAIGWVYAWKEPFKIVSMYCDDEKYNSIEELIDGINNKRKNYVNKNH